MLEMKATLILEDGTRFEGDLHGYQTSVSGEIVFQTGMVGYVESLTDPSYAKQLLTLTYPLIGNYGVSDMNLIDQFGLSADFESDRVWPSALVVERLCEEGEHSHWKAIQSLDEWLRKSKVPCITGIDVRQLVKLIREKGTMKAKIVAVGDKEVDYPFVDVNEDNLVDFVSRKETHTYGNGETVILAVDCGMKNNQIRCLAKRGFKVKVVPWNHPIDTEKDYDGLFISNGPGDPQKCQELVKRLAKVFERGDKPVFGICLGHQLIARAIGAETYKLRYGNRGHNQPCTHTGTGRCYITSQNHGFAVDEKTLPQGWEVLFFNENDKTNEGIVHKEKPFFSVQFHPEHMAGPTDCEFLFDVFADSVRKSKVGIELNINKAITERIAFEPVQHVSENLKKVLILGSGGLTIGQAGEFDYSGAQALKALKEEGIKTVLINPNIATVQTSKGFADSTYFLPITKEYVTDVIRKERPQGILCTFGGQTALNCAIDLYKDGIFEEYNVQVLGTQITTIMKTEDRELFNEEVAKVGEQVAPSKAATTLQEVVDAAKEIGYPVLVRAAYALGGLGSGFANNEKELVELAQQALAHSKQVLVDKSLKGWKEVEYEVVRDAYDNCITVCNMENLDPLGIHTGESVVVAPSQTLTDKEYNMLRTCAVKMIRHLGIVGECNIQYALDPFSLTYYIIEVNARLSRSSALASKATGYPLAYVAARLALGHQLPKLRNSVTGETTACFEPSLDYCVVKIPRWDLGKFARVSTQIGSSMKSVGEVMGIGRCFEEAFQKALRMVSDYADGFSPYTFPRKIVDEDISCPTDRRIFAIARGMYYGDFDVERVYELTSIDRWFLYRMHRIIETFKQLEAVTLSSIPTELLLRAKQIGFSDRQISKRVGSTEWMVREVRTNRGIRPCIKQIDTVAGEYPAKTNYLYVTYCGSENDVQFNLKNSVIVLGSGVYRIGSSVEFDSSCVGCIRELKSLGYTTITVNCNPETVSTDYDICDRLYFEEISFETVIDIYQLENPLGVILAFGGQAPNNIAMSLSRANVKILGTSPDDIDNAEDRFKFSRKLEALKISQPQWKKSEDIDDAKEFCAKVGYPCLIRPSYVLSGAAMNVAHNEEDLSVFLKQAAVVAKEHPVVVSKFISEAKELDVDAVAMDGKLIVMAVSEHVENAGVHSGDATLVTPPQDLNKVTLGKIRGITIKIAEAFNVNGPFNMQLIAKDNELKVIECNLRVSRSFPFVSKTLDYDFVAMATRAIMSLVNDQLKTSVQPTSTLLKGCGRVGCKVPQFSFSRLAGADVMLGVEMSSTGEVACFGNNRYEAYLKALLSTGFVVPKANIFISIGGYHGKAEMLKSVETLVNLGFKLYGSKGTADYFQTNNIKMNVVDWPFEEGVSDEKTSSGTRSVVEFFENREFHLIINLPIRGNGAYRMSAFRTHGYKTRRMAIDNGIPLITDIKCAKMFIQALNVVGRRPAMNSQIDCTTSRTLIRLPGLVDIHVHVREPGATHKEDWRTCTKAALAGGVTTILAMPNTNPPLTDEASLAEVELLASEKAFVDYGLYLGATKANSQFAKGFSKRAVGLKIFLNPTFSTLMMENVTDWATHFSTFPKNVPIVCHAEKDKLAAVLCIAQLANRSVHICHVATKEEIGLIREAKLKGWNVTCEVCPHHLVLTEEDLPEGVREVRPRLVTKEDCDALWENLEYIDCFATDHAPHTWAEKKGDSGAIPPGFPGVEFMLPLLLTAVAQGKLTLQDVIDRLSTNPKRIFNIRDDKATYVEVDLQEEWTIPSNGGYSKALWTPYGGRRVKGRVVNVVIRGEEAFVDGVIVAKPGSGQNVRTIQRERSETASVTSVSPTAVIRERSLSQSSTIMGDSTELVSKSPDLLQINFASKHLISVTHLDKNNLNTIFDVADRYKHDVEKHHPLTHILQGRVLVNLFYEPSTRTSCSFAAAMQRLGGSVISVDSQTSSVTKGETFEDTVRILGGYGDVLAIRSKEIGAAAKAAKVCSQNVINAGDGAGEHPTQALLDIYTIRQEMGTVNGTTIALVGDLKHGRTVHSLAKLLCLYKNITLHYVAPTKELQMPTEITDYISAKSDITQKYFTDLAEGIHGVDVVYVTRVQKERFESQAAYEKVKGSYVLTPKLLDDAVVPQDNENILVPARSLPIVMHPLPRVDEISVELDNDERAAYFRQAKNGLYVRMSILSLLLGRANVL